MSFIPVFASMWIRVFVLLDYPVVVHSLGNCTREQKMAFAVRRAFDGRDGILFCNNILPEYATWL